tara:strand:- start:705 stop:932 length:228 start_codon:yes stop_codon:yes gene_type:complete
MAKFKISIEWEDTESKDYGDFIIKVAVNLQLKLVIDFEDFRFLPPLKLLEWAIVTVGSPPTIFIISEKNYRFVEI